MIRYASALMFASLITGCATWESMDRSEKGTAVGATGGAVVGAAVGGPVGAAVGAGVGGYTGHYEANDIAGNSTRSASALPATSPTVRMAQQALNDRGYDAGNADGVWGPDTANAVRRFQQAQGLPDSGALDTQTLSALGVGR
jgi:phage tail tape-measure protein